MNEIRHAWAYLTWKHWCGAIAAGMLMAILIALEVLHLSFFWTPWKIVYHAPFYVAFACVFVFSIGMAEASSTDARPSLWKYVASALAASLTSLALTWSFSDYVVQAPRRVVPGDANTATRYMPRHKTTSAIFAVGFDGILHCWLATFIYVGLRNSRLAARALAQAQIQRSESKRLLVASQLEAAKAQIDPAFLSQTLRNIERTYEKDPSRGEILLDELIEYLRAAIPRLRSDERADGNEPASQSSPG